MKNIKYTYFGLIILLVIFAGLYIYFSKTKTVYIVSSLPSFSAGTTRGQVRAIQLALEDHGYMAGKYKVEWISLDNSTKEGWSLTLESKNANDAVINKDVVAYYGPFNSGSAIGSMPILNKAGLLQLSGSMTWPGLTKSGYGIGEPQKYYPTGERHFYRVVPNDGIQGLVAAKYMKQNDIRTVAVIHDGGVYGQGVSSIFTQNASENGIQTVYTGVVPGDKVNPNVVDDIVKMNPDAVFIGSEVLPGISATYSDLRIKKYKGIIFGSDFIDNNIEGVINREDEKVFTLMPGETFGNEKNPTALSFYPKYKQRFSEEPSQYSFYAYQSIDLILHAIEKSDGTRAGVLRSFKGNINNINPIADVVIFDTYGDMLENSSTIFRMINSVWTFEQTIII